MNLTPSQESFTRVNNAIPKKAKLRRMPYLLLLLLTTLAFGRSVVPNRVVTPNLDLFSRYNKTLPDGSVEVRVTTISKRGEFVQNGSKKNLPKETFDRYLKPSLAVFEMIPEQNNNSEERKYRRGTAFSIGNNLVLTNNHVLDESFQNTKDCADFQILDHSGETFDCKTVHYCNPRHDICLIEMEPKIVTKREGCIFCRGTKVELSLAQGPSLKLKSQYAPENKDAEILTAIGNSAGLGIHFSQGRGLMFNKDRTYFYAPITKGNSGGPLLNNEGLVVGVIKLQSKTLIHTDPDEAFNIAAPIELVIRLVRDGLRDNPEILEKFNQSVVE